MLHYSSSKANIYFFSNSFFKLHIINDESRLDVINKGCLSLKLQIEVI